MSGLAIPPGALLMQHGIAMQQSIMQFIGQAQHGLHVMHGFMHGSMQAIGQSAMLRCQSNLGIPGLSVCGSETS